MNIWANCDNCKHFDEDAYDCSSCLATRPPSQWEPAEHYQQPTNADHIRSLTDEELAALLDAFCESSECRTADGAVCPFYSGCPHDENIGCNGTCGIWTDWLKQPYKEDV